MYCQGYEFGNSESIFESDDGGTNDDPEYFFRHDVLSFGKVLFELLTGKMHQGIFSGDAESILTKDEDAGISGDAESILTKDEDAGIVSVEHFISTSKEKHLCLDQEACILEEGKEAQ